MATDALELTGIVEVDDLETASEPIEIPKVADALARVSPEQLTQGLVALEEVGASKQVVDVPTTEMFQEGKLGGGGVVARAR
ncbi:hypothetical protein Nepgr_017729 [Nepenthes gracilis]|uniref:Uncharacterized protein n=1 Tax=Nepenthes gracilis TaxID=150966 RepID=A0AAD3SPY5_NEPGR|nr:hypothetical protein Nepgr_017729 [Nepenthes gracilis]